MFEIEKTKLQNNSSSISKFINCRESEVIAALEEAEMGGGGEGGGGGIGERRRRTIKVVPPLQPVVMIQWTNRGCLSH